MTIHLIVYNPLSPSTPITPFPPFRLSTLRLWDVGNWRSLESTDGQYDRTTMDGTITVAQQNGGRDFIFYSRRRAGLGVHKRRRSLYGNMPGACDAPDMRAFDDFVTSFNATAASGNISGLPTRPAPRSRSR